MKMAPAWKGASARTPGGASSTLAMSTEGLCSRRARSQSPCLSPYSSPRSLLMLTWAMARGILFRRVERSVSRPHPLGELREHTFSWKGGSSLCGAVILGGLWVLALLNLDGKGRYTVIPR